MTVQASLRILNVAHFKLLTGRLKLPEIFFVVVVIYTNALKDDIINVLQLSRLCPLML